MNFSIIVPVYNEGGCVMELMRAIVKEIVIVDDGSTDDTKEILYRLITHETNKGKGAAIRTGLTHATGDYVLIQDADMEYSPKDYPKLLKPVLTDHAEAVYGSRILGKGTFLPSSYLANRALTLLTNLLFGSHLTDLETGYKLVKTDLLRSLNLTSSRFEIEPEITCKLLKRGVNIVEVPVSYEGRRTGKKIGWRDGVQAVWNLLKWRLR